MKYKRSGPVPSPLVREVLLELWHHPFFSQSSGPEHLPGSTAGDSCIVTHLGATGGVEHGFPARESWELRAAALGCELGRLTEGRPGHLEEPAGHGAQEQDPL